ncbi:MAG: ABC transporter permease [Flavobacteriales bacterium]|nr:ABC transporter permease [Flavobacteriales bacterium]
MNRTGLIIQREYLSRVRKKSFVVMTLLGPILMASLFIVPVLIAESGSPQQEMLVLDETDLFTGYLADNDEVRYTYLDEMDLDQAKTQLKENEAYGLLYIPCGQHCDLNYIEKSIQIYSEKTIGIDLKYGIKRQLEREIENLKLRRDSVDLAKIEAAKTSITISTISLEGEKEEENFSEATTAVGFIMAFLIYMFIFLYGAQVMRGVIEEKSSRIVEVIISSVRPFQLMLGKIVGVAMVGLTQFLLWVILTFAIVTVAQLAFFGDTYSSTEIASQMSGSEVEAAMQAAQNEAIPKIMKVIDSINFPLIIGCFIFYFLGGYLLYGALFAAIGSAVDNESDTQQFMLPVTIPLILAIIVAQTTITNPESPIAFWFSIIPFTSPIIMMVRVAMGVPTMDLVISMILLVLGFLGTVWVAAKIYRTGILMYGKKVSYGEILKWIKFKG